MEIQNADSVQKPNKNNPNRMRIPEVSRGARDGAEKEVGTRPPRVGPTNAWRVFFCSAALLISNKFAN